VDDWGLCVWEIDVKDCPACGQDHDKLSFYGRLEREEAKALCPRTARELTARRQLTARREE